MRVANTEQPKKVHASFIDLDNKLKLTDFSFKMWPGQGGYLHTSIGKDQVIM